MSFTSYNDASTSLGQVRLLVGDRDPNDQLLQDEDISFFLSEESNKYIAASRACEAIAIGVGQRLTIKGDVGIDQDQQYKHWMDRARSLKARGSRVAPFAGGISIADKETREDNTDRFKPAFARDMQVAPGQDLGVTESDLTSIRR